MTTMNLQLTDGVHILTLTNAENGGDNRLTTEVVEEYLAALDIVEQYQGNTALLLTCSHEKTFCTGINLDWLLPLNDADRREFTAAFETLLCRLALLSAPTVACINGNTYAGGAIVASATDFRLMRSDRGRFCYPEVDIKIPFTQVSSDIGQLLPNQQAVKNMMLTGVAYTGLECAELQIVDAIYPQDQLQQEAFSLAKTLASKDRQTYCTNRNLMRPEIVAHANNLTQ
ncbi:enoyl-CoA hydratase/isomerase family protein [Porticoccaceae bacterium]|nr:enoyl-CoA hydratase/isomerase family protein [Porticoccaceae bacterium]